jgi:hypothetical protein
VLQAHAVLGVARGERLVDREVVGSGDLVGRRDAPPPRMPTDPVSLSAPRERVHIAVTYPREAQADSVGAIVKPMPVAEQHRDPIPLVHPQPWLRWLRWRHGVAAQPGSAVARVLLDAERAQPCPDEEALGSHHRSAGWL